MCFSIASLFGFRVPSPGKKLTRFFLTVYIISVIGMQRGFRDRTVEWISQEMRRPDVKTIDEMIEKNFTFYISNLVESYGEMEFISR